MVVGQWQRVREHQRQAGAQRPQEQRAHVADNRLDLVLDVRLAHRVDEELRDHEPLQRDGHDDQQDAAEPDLRVDEKCEDPQQDPLGRDRVDDAADPAHPERDEVERKAHDQQGVEKLGHGFTSPAE